jgi:hypothetical protein
MYKIVHRLLFTSILILLHVQCDDLVDIFPPKLEIQFPSKGSSVCESFNVILDVKDNEGVKKVEIVLKKIKRLTYYPFDIIEREQVQTFSIKNSPWKKSVNHIPGSYEISAKAFDNAGNFIEKNHEFSISEESSGTSSITVTSPNGGESWEEGDTKSITWTSSNVSGNVGIYLYRNGSNANIISSSTSNDGNYTWSIPSSLTESSSYKVRIYSTSNSSIQDYSDAYFSISEESSGTSSITVTSPNGGESWEYFTTQNILWSSFDIECEWVYIYLHKNGEFYKTISSGTPDDGTYSWGISSNIDISNFYQILIQSECDNSIYDTSNNFFSIYQN